MNNRHLEDITSLGDHWTHAAHELLADETTAAEQMGRNAHRLAAMVIFDPRFSIKDLREEVRIACGLDGQAVLLSREVEFTEADHFEALTRRIAHHTAKAALRLVNSDEQRTAPRYRYVFADEL